MWLLLPPLMTKKVVIQHQNEVPLSPASSIISWSSSPENFWISSQGSSPESSRSSSPDQTLYNTGNIFDNPPESPNHSWLISYQKGSNPEIFDLVSPSCLGDDWKSDHENDDLF